MLVITGDTKRNRHLIAVALEREDLAKLLDGKSLMVNHRTRNAIRAGIELCIAACSAQELRELVLAVNSGRRRSSARNGIDK